MEHQLPTAEYVVFGKPALALVLGQVRFPILPRFPDPDYVDSFYQGIREDYPRTQRTSQFAFPALAEQMAAQVSTSLLWRFSSVDGQWSLILSENALTLESRGYRSLPEFVDRFVSAVEHFVTSLNPALQVRLGLRYINEFRIPDTATLVNWRTYIRPEVLGLTAVAHELFDEGRVNFSRQEFEVVLPDGSLVIRHGLHTGTTVEAAEAAQAAEQSTAEGPFYLLDLDRSDTTTRDIDSDAIRFRFGEFNHQMYSFFRWAIEEPLYQALEPTNGG